MDIGRGKDFDILLTDRGEVFAWGENNYGQLGIGTTDNDYHEPTKIDLTFQVRHISVGYYHVCH